MKIRSTTLGLTAWLGLGVGLFAWLSSLELSRPLLFGALMMAPWLALTPGLVTKARNAYAYSMLAAIVYSIVAAMETLSLPPSLPAAASFLAASLLCFFLLLPAVRWQRRLEKSEQKAE